MSGLVPGSTQEVNCRCTPDYNPPIYLQKIEVGFYLLVVSLSNLLTKTDFYDIVFRIFLNLKTLEKGDQDGNQRNHRGCSRWFDFCRYFYLYDHRDQKSYSWNRRYWNLSAEAEKVYAISEEVFKKPPLKQRGFIFCNLFYREIINIILRAVIVAMKMAIQNIYLL